MLTVSDGLIIAATLIGPIAAVQVQKWIERARQRSEKRASIFETLMATRAIRALSTDHVQALNLIDLHFHGNSNAEQNVRVAWDNYLDFLKQPPPLTEIEAKSHNEKGIDLLMAMLAIMAGLLGYSFTKVQLLRDGYYPIGQSNEILGRQLIRDNLIKVLTGEQPISMSITRFPVTPEVAARQEHVQEALLATLNGTRPLKVMPVH